MSEHSLPNDGSSAAVDSTFQRKWNQYAMPDLSVDAESSPTPLALASPGSTNATIAVNSFDSLPTYGSSTALGDAFAKAEAIDLPPAEDFSTSADGEAF
jgi:hypothetical protein